MYLTGATEVLSLSNLSPFHRRGNWEPPGGWLKCGWRSALVSHLEAVSSLPHRGVLTWSPTHKQDRMQGLGTHPHQDVSSFAICYALFCTGTDPELVTVTADLRLATSEGHNSTLTQLGPTAFPGNSWSAPGLALRLSFLVSLTVPSPQAPPNHSAPESVLSPAPVRRQSLRESPSFR